MKRQWVWASAFVLVAGCDGVLGIESAEPVPPPPPDTPECTMDAECVEEGYDKDCTRFTCEEGECKRHYVDLGAPIPSQVAGDCLMIVCDGAGKPISVAEVSDAIPDENPCTREECFGSELKHTPISETNAPCYTGPPGTVGVGICQVGVVECDTQGNAIGCKDQVLPQTEICQTAIDENCNGSAAMLEGCTCGDGIVTGNEQCDDGNTSDADDCSKTCQVQRVEQLVGGALHLCARLSTGVVKCWGHDGNGQLGVDGEYSWGWNKPWEMGANLPPVVFPLNRKVKQIHASHNNPCVVFEDGGTRCWGNNHRCVLGLAELCPTPEIVNTEIPWTENPASLPRDIPPVNGQVESIVGLHAHKCALLKDGQVKCWGYNAEGALGLADDTFLDHPEPTKAINFNGEKVVALAAGGFHNCALFASGAVRCWGYNGYGQLGRNNTVHYGRYTGQMGSNLAPVPLAQAAMAVAAGEHHSCALLANRRIKCWGNNDFGQLGIGTKQMWAADATYPIENLPFVPLSLPVGAYVTAIHAHHYQTCAIISDGTARCWGDNQFDAYLQGADQQVSPFNITNASLAPVIDFGPNAKILELAQTNISTCARLSTGNVKCWGTDLWKLGADPVNGQIIGDSLDELGPQIPTTRLFNDVW